VCVSGVGRGGRISLIIISNKISDTRLKGGKKTTHFFPLFIKSGVKRERGARSGATCGRGRRKLGQKMYNQNAIGLSIIIFFLPKELQQFFVGFYLVIEISFRFRKKNYIFLKGIS
jgi:hypothetical protein